MNIEFVDHASTKDLETRGSFIGNWHHNYNSKEQYKTELRKIIFEPVEAAIMAGESVEIYKTTKANGENAQVSYVPSLDS